MYGMNGINGMKRLSASRGEDGGKLSSLILNGGVFFLLAMVRDPEISLGTTWGCSAIPFDLFDSLPGDGGCR